MTISSLKNSQGLDLASANKRYRSMGAVGSGGGGGGSDSNSRTRSGRVGSRMRGFGVGGGGSVGWPGYGHGVNGGSVNGSGSGRSFRYPHGLEAASSGLPSPLQRQTGPIKRLPPVLDMSPEMRSPSSGNFPENFSLGTSSPGGSAVAIKGRGRSAGRWAGKQGSWRHQAGAVGPLSLTRWDAWCGRGSRTSNF